MAERRERERAERRLTILDAAESVFLEGGVARATMDDVARRAELSKGALYLYFENKDALFIAIAHRAIATLRDHLTDPPVTAETGLSELRQRVERYLDFGRVHPQRFEVAISWLSQGYETDADTPGFRDYQDVLDELTAIGGAAIERGKRDGTIRGDISTPTLTLQLWSALIGVLLTQVRQEGLRRRFRRPIDLGGLGAAFVDVILRGMAASPMAIPPSPPPLEFTAGRVRPPEETSS